MVARDPSSVAPTVFPRAGEPYELVTEMGVDAKFSAIVAGISGGLGFAAETAATRSGDAASLRPWADGVSPLIRLESIEAEYAKNEALIDALTAHLVEHIVIREELRAQAERARRHASLENRRIPEFMEEFAQRLVASGVVKGDLRFMSKTRFESIVGILRQLAEKDLNVSPLISGWDVDGPSEPVFPQSPGGSSSAGREGVESRVGNIPAISGEGDGEPSGTVGSDASTPPAGGDADGLEESVSDVPDRVPEPVSDPVPEPMPEPVAEPVPEPAAPLAEALRPVVPEPAAARWDVLEVERLGFEIEEVQPTTDGETGVMRMRLPEVDSLADMALPSGIETTWLNNVRQFADVGIAERLIRSWAERNGVRLSDRDVRAWVFLLVVASDLGRSMPRDAMATFDGVVLPGRRGSAKVRRVRWVGE